MERAFSYSELDESFFDEASELLENAAGLVVVAEKEKNLAPAIPEVFRTFHTIKGGAQMVGCEMLATFAHQVEDLLDQVRTGIRQADMFVASLVLDAVGLMEEEISIYRSGEHPDQLSDRQADILARVRALNQRGAVSSKPAVQEIVPISPDVLSVEETGVSAGGKRLVYLFFKIDEDAPMPEIAEILIRQRIQESGRLIYSNSISCGSAAALEAVMQTDLEDKALKRACDAADVKEIHIKELSLASFYYGSLPVSIVEEFLSNIRKLDSVVSQTKSSSKEITDLINRLSLWGDECIEYSGCFGGGRQEWDRALELLKTGLSLWSSLRSAAEQRLLLAQLVQNLWECVYVNLENKVYFFSLRPVAVGEGTGLLQDVKRRVKGTAARVLVLDLSAVALLEADGVAALMEVFEWLKTKGIIPWVVAKGDFRHRHQYAFEALASSMDGLVIFSSAYQGCLAGLSV